MKDTRVKEGDTIAIWFSCGAASAIAALKTVELYGDICNIRIINNPIKEEHEDNQRFLKDVQSWLDTTIEFAISDEFPSQSCDDVWRKRKYMANQYGAPCTLKLKKEPRQKWEASNHHDWIVLGFTAEEKQRADRFKLTERGNLLTPLIDFRLTKGDCFRILTEHGIGLPEVYKLGLPNANCIGCVKASGVTYWNHIRKVFPDVFKKRAKDSREYGAKLVKYKGERIYLDELPEDAVGRPMKNLDFECGIFCMEEENIECD